MTLDPMPDAATLHGKACSRCARTLEPSAFSADKRAADGLRSDCKACAAAYRSANRARFRGYERQYRAQNPSMHRETIAKWRRTYPDKVREANHRSRHQNPEASRLRDAAYYQANRARLDAKAAARRAGKRGVQVGDRVAYRAFLAWARTSKRIRCYWCGASTAKRDRHVDHVIPMAQGGADAVANLCVACTSCNLRKGPRLPEVFAGQSELRLA